MNKGNACGVGLVLSAGLSGAAVSACQSQQLLPRCCMASKMRMMRGRGRCSVREGLRLCLQSVWGCTEARAGFAVRACNGRDARGSPAGGRAKQWLAYG